VTVDIPQELKPDWQLLCDRWRDTELEPWRLRLVEQMSSGMSVKRYGDIPRWRKALSAMPPLLASERRFNESAVGCHGVVTAAEQSVLERALRGLHPCARAHFIYLVSISIPSGARTGNGSAYCRA